MIPIFYKNNEVDRATSIKEAQSKITQLLNDDQSGINDASQLMIGLPESKKYGLDAIKTKASQIRKQLTNFDDQIYLLGLLSKSVIARAVLSNTALSADLIDIKSELKTRKALGKSPKSYTIEQLATEQVNNQIAYSKMASFVEYFEKNAIAQIEAQTTVETVKSTLQQLNTDANTALEKLMTTA